MKDSEIRSVSLVEARIVVTKDADFVDSFILRNEPFGLLLVTTGNISNEVLCRRIADVEPALVESFQSAKYVEISLTELVIHQ